MNETSCSSASLSLHQITLSHPIQYKCGKLATLIWQIGDKIARPHQSLGLELVFRTFVKRFSLYRLFSVGHIWERGFVWKLLGNKPYVWFCKTKSCQTHNFYSHEFVLALPKGAIQISWKRKSMKSYKKGTGKHIRASKTFKACPLPSVQYLIGTQKSLDLSWRA